MKKIALVLAAVVLSLNVIQAQQPAVMTSTKPGWHKIGETTASMKSEKDEIMVIGADKFKSIKLKVTDASVHIASLVVYYDGGDAENINIASDLKAGQESRVIDLKGGTREIKRVGFVYKSVPNSNNEKAHIELYGMK